MQYFFVDEKRNIKKTYTDLINDINKKKTCKKIIYTKDVYLTFLELIHSIIVGCSIEILDMDFSTQEIENLGVKYSDISNEINANCEEIIDFRHLLKKIRDKKSDWNITMYTSGTTGRPKKVSHRLETLTRGVKTGDKFIQNIWAFCYNPTHIAGLQVFFQAFFNKNPIIYGFDYTPKEFHQILNKYQVTNISATPTFYRSCILGYKQKNIFVESLTLGGEKFDSTLTAELQEAFPNSKTRNVYASTEAGSLFSSTGELFKIKPKIKPYIKINDDGELLINKAWLGELDNFPIVDGWYSTGDLVEMINNTTFKFISRKSEMINIGGYKANPNEIEEEIKKVEGVIDVIVKARKNKLVGNILIAEIVKRPEVDGKYLEKKIQKYLLTNLQKWKIPRIYKFVEQLNKSRTGKKVRV